MDIKAYNTSQNSDMRIICEALEEAITTHLNKSEAKVWHGHPVWFLEGNPIVGYAVRKNGVQLLFWSGQSFDEPRLEHEGSFKAAQKYYSGIQDISDIDLERWLHKSERIQWDYKNIVKRKGVLERIK